MIKKLAAYVGQYKKQAILTPVLVIAEVAFEVFIPLLMARIVDIGIGNGDYGYVFRMGGLMVLMALCALITGAFCARCAVTASNGFAKNLRMALCVILVIPIACAYPFFQRYIVKGLTVGAVKG